MVLTLITLCCSQDQVEYGTRIGTGAAALHTTMLGHIWRRVLRSSSVLRRDVQATAAADPSSVLMSERDLEDEIKVRSGVMMKP